MAGIEDFLPTPIASATPQQIQEMREYAATLSKRPQRRGPYGWANALDTISGDIMGALVSRRAGELERGGLAEGAKSVPTFDTSEPGENTPTASATASTSSQTADQTSSTPGGGGAAAGQPATNAADISTRLETGHSDPMKGLANISPDTNGSKSYGNFGLNSQPGYSAHDFKRDYGEPLGLTATPGTPEFDAQWLKSVRDNPVAHRAAEVDWYNKNVVSGVSSKLEKVGVSKEIASDPRVGAYFSDRVVQQGPGSITGERHAARIQAAYSSSGEDPVKFLKAMSAADRTPEALQADFPRALKSGVYSQRGNDNRVMGREALSLGLPMPTAGAAPPPTQQQAIAPMVNALAGTSGNVTTVPMGAGASISAPANAIAQQEAPQTIAGALKATGVPGPDISPTGALAPQQQAVVSAIGGQGGAAPPGAAGPGPAAMTQAIAGPAGPAPTAAAKGPDIPPSLPMSSLPSPEKIRAGFASNIPQYVEQAKNAQEYRQKLLTPQQVKMPDGTMVVGTPYTGYYKMGISGQPDFVKSPYEVGGLKGESFLTVGQGPNGQPVLRQTPVVSPGGPAGGGGGAGVTDEFPANGTVAEKVAWANRNKIQVAEQEGYAKKIGETYATKQGVIEKRAADAQDELPQLQTLQKVINDPSFYSGFRSGNVEAMSSALRAVGFSGDTATLMEYAKKLGSAASLENIREMGESGAVRVPEMHMIEKSNFDINNTPAANSAIVDIRLRLAQRQIETADLANAYANAHGGRIDRGFDQALREHYKDNPLFSKAEIERYDHILSGRQEKNPEIADARANTVPPAAVAELAADPSPENKTGFEKHFGLTPGTADEMLRGLQKPPTPPPAAPQAPVAPPPPQPQAPPPVAAPFAQTRGLDPNFMLGQD